MAPDERFTLDAGPDVLATLVDEHLEVDRDVVPLAPDTWAIHGYLAYEGDVICCTFPTERAAWAGISRIEELYDRLR
jgi:hypothetical protein